MAAKGRSYRRGRPDESEIAVRSVCTHFGRQGGSEPSGNLPGRQRVTEGFGKVVPVSWADAGPASAPVTLPSRQGMGPRPRKASVMTASILLADISRRRAPADACDVQPCFGVACRIRTSCVCYDAVERAPGGA